MTCLEQHKVDSDQWYSPPFYTHPQGYKMCLRVDANGHGEGKGTHVSVSVYLMRGEFDDVLKWPFRGHVVIQLSNQLQDKYHRGHTIDFSETTDARIISRVTSGERAESGFRCHPLIPHNDLNFNPTTNCQYLKNDCLHFQIVAAELSEPGVLPAGRTMTCLEQHKVDSDQWYSLPFYTHPQGYKMCLRVDANGHGEGKGTYVSVSVYLMRGEFDDVLKWPFRGHVVIQLCNQLQDKYHRGHTIDFSETTDARIISRVTSGERADSGCGSPTLIPHNDLNFNPNCQYLRNDCLHFRIVAAELSEPGVFPAGRTMTCLEQHKLDSDQWYSRPFYTHPQGYRMCLRVDADGNGKGKGTHVSVFAYLMRGEFDDVLKWPFRGHVVIQLCNQLQDRYHHGHTIDFNQTTDANCNVIQMTSGGRGKVWGLPTFIPHNNLKFNPTTNCQYLKNNCLHFQIVAVESLSEPGVLPAELTMTNFEEHKISSNDWYSLPFYTHPQGYKMCLNVDANGYGKGKGTHVSVFVYLMRGEFDNHLKWPFRGHVTVAMLNQLEDTDHTTETITPTDKTNSEAIGRVTERERAPRGWGYATFIANAELNYNPTKNCQYLKYDCLRFRIVKVEGTATQPTTASASSMPVSTSTPV